MVGWFTGYDIRFAKYSPGLIHLMEMAEQFAAAGISAISMGKGATRYTQNLKSHDVFVAKGVVTGRSALGALHGVSGASVEWAVRGVRRHPALHRAANQALRLSGVSRTTYGRV